MTLSKYEFPWRDIAEGMPFTAKECYEKYITMVRDPHTFLKRVLNGGSNIIKDKYMRLMHNQLDQAPRILVSEPTAEEDVFCVCKGTNPSGFFVACEAGDDCPFGGWLHPECTEDLRNISKEHIDNLDQWYCEACRRQIQQEDEEKLPLASDQQSQEEDSDSERELEAQIEADRLEAEQIQRDIDQENLNQASEDA